jgi:hypothetical protein
MHGYGFFQAELDARRLEHALASERAALAAQLGPLPAQPRRNFLLRALLARLLRRQAAPGPERVADTLRCGSMYAPGSRRCLNCGAGGRRTRGNWRRPSRCVERKRAWTSGRQHV